MVLPQQVQDAATQINNLYSTPSEVEQPVEVKPEPTPAPAGVPVEDDWKKRFTGYKQSTDKTIHELRTHKVESEEQIRQLAAQVQQLQAAQDNPQKESNLFSTDELGEVGQVVNSKTDALDNRLATLEAAEKAAALREQQRLAESSKDALMNQIKEKVVDFDDIDVDPKFHQYLNELDEYGNLRLDLFKVARQSNDVAGMVRFYTDFKVLHVQEQPLTQKELQQAPTSMPLIPKPQGGGRIWDNAAIQRFYRDKTLGKITEAEASALEHEMHQWVNANRR